MKTTNKVSRLSRYISLLIASLISRQVACWKIDRLKIIYNRSWRLTRKITWLNRNIHLTLVNPALPFVVRIYTILANLKTRRTTTTNEVTRGIDQLLEANALANQVSQFTMLPGNKLISEALRPSVAAACLICGGTEFAIRSTELDVRPAKEDGSGQRGVATGPASSRRVMRSITQRAACRRPREDEGWRNNDRNVGEHNALVASEASDAGAPRRRQRTAAAFDRNSCFVRTR